MKKIAVVTATRAEFGLLKPLIQRLRKVNQWEISLLVTGMHLSEEFGNTFREIEDSGIPIACKIPCLSGGDYAVDITGNMAMALQGFGEYFDNNSFDLVIILGDRYEMLSVAICAMNARIPIAHIHGGETTEGAIDEAIRHSITKMSYLHFTSTEAYRKRVIQLGESPDRVFNVGALGIENILNLELMTKAELEKDLSFSLGEVYGVVTFHPVTLDDQSVEKQFAELQKALDSFTDMSFVITKANADAGGRKINQKIDEYAKKRENILAVSSLGVMRYLSAVKYSAVVIGNSSSGVIEVPVLKVPTVNVGDRQRGRLMADSVICCPVEGDEIVASIKKAMTDAFQEKVQKMQPLFGNGRTSEQIVEILKQFLLTERHMDLKKKFYDL